MPYYKRRLVDKPRACECGDHAFLSLTRGFMIRFDIEDMEFVGSHVWCAQGLPTEVYASTNLKRIKGEPKRMGHLHRMLSGATGPDVFIDHADRDRLNNKRNNIRRATRSQNAYNKLGKDDGSSKYKGVRWHRKKAKWHVRVQFEEIVVGAGYCKDEIEAARRYDKVAKRLHGEFAVLNFPD
jgi:hypothetical protein